MNDARYRILYSAGRRRATCMCKAGYAAHLIRRFGSGNSCIDAGAAGTLVARISPLDLRQEQRSIDAILIPYRNVHERIEQRVREEMRLQAEIDQLGMFGVVIVLF